MKLSKCRGWERVKGKILACLQQTKLGFCSVGQGAKLPDYPPPPIFIFKSIWRKLRDGHFFPIFYKKSCRSRVLESKLKIFYFYFQILYLCAFHLLSNIPLLQEVLLFVFVLNRACVFAQKVALGKSKALNERDGETAFEN